LKIASKSHCKYCYIKFYKALSYPFTTIAVILFFFNANSGMAATAAAAVANM
jgi:hypothetical protein